MLAICFCANAQHIEDRLDSLMLALRGRGQFNGSVLVSVNGKMVYEKAYGKADLNKNEEFTTSTPCYLASLSKQFTAMGIMMLGEKKLLNFNDPLSKYFSEFPPYGQTVTIQNLLNHTSGIVDYEKLGIDHPGLTNKEVFDNLIKQGSLRFKSGDKYEYSNSGYILLAMIIEKVSGMSFSEFMEKNIFQPLGMNDSFVFDKSTSQSKSRAKGYGKFGDISDYDGFTVGDGGIFSAVDDLFKWDKALYTDKLVSQAILNKAFTPAILNDGIQSLYGFGWMLKNENGGQIVYHTGGSGGFRTFIERQLNGHNAIIILTNTENSPRTEIRNAIVNILENNQYALPKISIATEMYTIRNKNGTDSAINFYNFNKLRHSDTYDFREQELNLLGYKLWSIKKINEAVEIFKLNVTAYPGSSNTYESLGEAYLEQGDKQMAAESFNKSLSIDPQNSDTIRMLKKINNK
jgi:CubicO group peptidase (beta-lactamase class C family)